jgi:hypothetical protein
MKQLLCLVLAALTVTALCAVGHADDERPARRQFKGVELYSWKDKAGDWRFALLSGTNVLKTEKQVKEAKEQYKGTAELKKQLGHLAVGEQVVWAHRIAGFEFPLEETRKEIQKAAKGAEIKLTIVEPKP